MNAFPAGPDPVDSHIVRGLIIATRCALNRRLFGHAALRAIPPLAGAGVVLFLGWRLAAARDWLPGAAWFLAEPPDALPVPPAFLAWVVLILVGSLVFGLLSQRRWLDTSSSARWLDAKLGSADLFAAALDCLENKGDPIFSNRIAHQAAQAAKSSGQRSPGFFPWKKLSIRALIAAAMLSASALVLLWWNPEATLLVNSAARAQGQQVSSLDMAKDQANQAANAQAPTSTADQEAARLAQKLFPEDPRLAALAREALRQNDKAALDFLLAQNKLSQNDLDRLAKASQSDAEPPKAKPNQPKDQSSQNQQNPGNEQQEENQKQQQQNAPQPGNGAGQQGNPSQDDQGQGKQPPGSGDGQNQGGNGRTNEQTEDGSGTGTGNGAGNGGKSYGTGEANSTTAMRQKNGQKGKEALLKQDEGKPFEIVLPQKDHSLSLGSVIPEARRSAEAALSRRITPLSYEQFVTSYFTQLSQEAKP